MNTAEQLVATFRLRGLTCATAESCTGGGVGKAITSVAGASEVYLGGVVSYANSVKNKVLGVSESTLAEHGAVSAETAAAMAAGVRKLTGADVAISVTGIAGPDGGTAAKPVGTVWFAVAAADGVKPVCFFFSGGREEVRTAATEKAMSLLTDAAKKISED